MSKKKLFKISAACAGMLVGLGLLAGNAKAVQILGNVHETDFKLQGCGGGCSYLAAYEYYGNQGGVIVGNYTDNENPLIIKFILGKNYNATETVSIRLTGANFINPSNIDTGATQYCLYNGTAVVATQTGAVSYPTDTIFFQFNQNATPGTTLTLSLCNSNNETVQGSNPMIQLNPNLGASCTKSASVLIKWTAGIDCCEATLLQIQTKQTTYAGDWNFNVELDADRDFRTFLGGGTILNLCCKDRAQTTCSCGNATCTSSPSGSSGPSEGCPIDPWVLGANFDPTKGNILKVTFGVHSLNPEPGVKDIRFKLGENATLSCQKQSETDWICQSDCMPCPTCNAIPKFELELDNATSNNPTLWSIVNAAVSDICPTDPKVKDVCCVIKEGYVGAWYGGLEAIVPFMRADNGYATTMKFINRYNKPVKVYAQPFKHATDPIILATVLVGTIDPDGGVLTIKATDLAIKFPEANFKDGTSVKFLLIVPPQAGCISVGRIGSSGGTACYNNPNDPYVEGYVVYDTPQGTRTVPLKYKYWKQGAYNE